MKLITIIFACFLIISCASIPQNAQAFSPWEEDIQDLQNQIDELQDRLDADYTDKVRYHKKQQYYMMKPLCPTTPPPNVPDDAWFCSHPDKRPGRIDITYSPWTLANIYEDTRIQFSGPGVAGMVAYVTAVNMSGTFSMITWDDEVQFTNPVDKMALFINESRVYRFIVTVVPKAGGGYKSLIAGKVISRNFPK